MRLEMVLMRATRHDDDPVVITDAEESFEDELQHRKKVYAILMVIHLVGFLLAGIFAWLTLLWTALGLVIATGGLPWIAVVVANERRVNSQDRRATKPTSRSPQRRTA